MHFTSGHNPCAKHKSGNAREFRERAEARQVHETRGTRMQQSSVVADTQNGRYGRECYAAPDAMRASACKWPGHTVIALTVQPSLFGSCQKRLSHARLSPLCVIFVGRDRREKDKGRSRFRWPHVGIYATSDHLTKTPSRVRYNAFP